MHMGIAEKHKPSSYGRVNVLTQQDAQASNSVYSYYARVYLILDPNTPSYHLNLHLS